MNSVKSQLLQKPWGIKFERQKKYNNKMYLFSRFKDCMINVVSEKN